MREQDERQRQAEAEPRLITDASALAPSRDYTTSCITCGDVAVPFRPRQAVALHLAERRSSGAGLAGGGSGSTCVALNTASRRKYVRGRSSGTAPASRQACSFFFGGRHGAQIRMCDLSPRRTQ